MAKIKWKNLKLKLAAAGLEIFEKNLKNFFDNDEAIKLIQLKTDLLQEIVKVLRDKNPNDKEQIVQELKNFITGPGSDYAEQKLIQLVQKIRDEELQLVAASLVDPVDDALRILGDEDPQNVQQILDIAKKHYTSEETQTTILLYALPKIVRKAFKNDESTAEIIINMIFAALGSGESGFSPDAVIRVMKVANIDINAVA